MRILILISGFKGLSINWPLKETVEQTARHSCKFLYVQPKAIPEWANTVSVPRCNEPLYNEVLGLANGFLYPVIVKCMANNLDIMKPP